MLGRCAEPLNASGRLPRLSAQGDQWAAIYPAVRLGGSLLVGPRQRAQPVATLHVCSTPHVGGTYTAGYTPTAMMRTRTTGIVSPGHMKYHTSPLVMLGIGVRARCHSRALTILVYCASMKSTVTYAKRRCIVSVFGSPGLLPSCWGHVSQLPYCSGVPPVVGACPLFVCRCRAVFRPLCLAVRPLPSLLFLIVPRPSPCGARFCLGVA